MLVENQYFAGDYSDSASRKIRLIASGFEGFGSGCCAIQASSAASRSG